MWFLPVTCSTRLYSFLQALEACTHFTSPCMFTVHYFLILLSASRPATSFLWFTSPWKTFKMIIWKHYKWHIIGTIIGILLVLIIAILIYTLPVSPCPQLAAYSSGSFHCTHHTSSLCRCTCTHSCTHHPPTAPTTLQHSHFLHLHTTPPKTTTHLLTSKPSTSHSISFLTHKCLSIPASLLYPSSQLPPSTLHPYTLPPRSSHSPLSFSQSQLGQWMMGSLLPGGL